MCSSSVRCWSDAWELTTAWGSRGAGARVEVEQKEHRSASHSGRNVPHFFTVVLAPRAQPQARRISYPSVVGRAALQTPRSWRKSALRAIPTAVRREAGHEKLRTSV